MEGVGILAKYERGGEVANHVIPVPRVGILLPWKIRYDATTFVLSIVNITKMQTL
jgi:hypothetical protein